MCTTNSRLNNCSGQKRNRLMYFQLEVDCYSNEANKNKYTNFQLKTSIKSNLKKALTGHCTGHCTCNDNLSYFVAWT